MNQRQLEILAYALRFLRTNMGDIVYQEDNTITNDELDQLQLVLEGMYGNAETVEQELTQARFELMTFQLLAEKTLRGTDGS